MRQVLLSGEHPTLPAAELRSLLAVHDPAAVVDARAGGLVAEVRPGDAAACDSGLARMALAHAWGEPWGQADDDAHGLAELYDAVRQRASGNGSAAVVTERRGRDKSPRVLQVERSLGAALGEAGHRIDLARPDLVVYAWMVDGRIHAGRRLGAIDRSAYEARVAERRRHFSPVSLHPRRARSLLHLARVSPGGTLYDPFCGTGTFALEAALEGYRVLASDLDAFMVQGTLQTLADDGPEPLPGEAFVADIGEAPEMAGRVDGIVTDLPYGRASTTNREALHALYGRALAAFAAILQPGAHAVVGHPDPALLDGAEAAGFAVAERHEERAHRSLVRHFAVLRRRA